MQRQRVAITGMGVICALGTNLAETWPALLQGKSAIGPIQSVDVSKLRFQNGAEVRGYDPAQHFDGNRLDLLDRFSQFALVAARQALADSGLKLVPELAGKTAVVTGSCLGGQICQDAAYWSVYGERANRLHPLTIPRIMANAGASHISMELGISGPVFTVSTACSSANHAIGQAFWLVRNGQVQA